MSLIAWLDLVHLPVDRVTRSAASIAASAVIVLAGPMADGSTTTGPATTGPAGTGPAATAEAPARGTLRWQLPIPSRLPSGIVRRFDAPTGPWAPGHRGVDLLSTPGSPVVAPAAGIVTFSGQVAGRGVLVVTHPGGLRTSLEPVAAMVPVGTPVAAGATIAVLSPAMVSASVADSSTDHCRAAQCLHWGVRHGDRYLDPLLLVGPPRVILLPLPSG